MMDYGVRGSGMTVVRPPSSFKVRWIGRDQHGSLNAEGQLRLFRLMFWSGCACVRMDGSVLDSFAMIRATVELHMAWITK